MKTNLIYALRNILKNRVNSIITVIGLSVAIASCMIIYFYVSQEYSYNSFHKNADKIYRVNYEIKTVDGGGNDVRVLPELVKILKEKVPQIEKTVEYRTAFEQVLKYKNNYFDVETSYAGEDFFEIFSFDLIVGNSIDVFKNPYEIVLSKALADKLISDKMEYSDLLGQVIEYPLAFGSTKFQIVGITDEIPQNSSIKFDAIVSEKSGRNFGGCNNYIGYTSIFYLLKENANAKLADINTCAVLNDFYKSTIENMQANNQLIKTADAFRPFMLSLNEVYLEDDIFSCSESSNSRTNFFILITIGTLLLIIACSNYIILSLGQYIQKVADVGVRKVMGAKSIQIFAVFFAEGVIITSVAFLLGGMLCSLFLPIFGSLSQTEIYTELIDIPKVLYSMLLAFFAIVLFTSLIPVITFSKVSPNQMSSKKVNMGKKGILSQVFISFQYSLSIILIVITIFLIRQSNYLKSKSLGIDTEQIIDIDITKVQYDQKSLLYNLLESHAGVENLTRTSRNFMNGSSNSYVDKGDGQQISVFQFEVDDKYIPTLGLKLINGNNFKQSNINPNDRSMIVNKKFIEAFDIEDDPIGKSYFIYGIYFNIIGVVEDYHFFDLTQKIAPLMLFVRTNTGNPYNNILLKYNPKQLSEVVKHIEESYNKVAPGTQLDYSFWNENLNQRYQSQERWSKIIGYASVIAIIISSLGLFALTTLLTNQRTKEIGVRKVNGASLIDLLTLLNTGFIKWIVIAFIIACPAAYYFMNGWLKYFAYKIELSWWVFAIAGFVAVVIAFSTVTWQTWRAARINPVESLKYE